MSFELSFGQVEAVLAKLNRIADHKRVAFMSRLKHLQKNGCPTRDRPGRGKSGTYSFSQLMQTALAVELLQSGLPPALAAKIVEGNWLGIRSTVYMATYTKSEVAEMNEKAAAADEREMDDPDEWLWMISPESLRELTPEGVSDFDHYEAMMPVRLEDARRQLDSGVTVGIFGESWRTLVIHGSHLTQAVMSTVAYHFRFAEWKAMREDLVDEINEDERRFRAFSDEIKNMPASSPEKLKELKEKFGALRETDYSTNPPTPPSLTLARAKEIILHTDPRILAPMGHGVGTTIEIDGQTLQQLMFLRLMELDEGNLALTLLGAVVNSLISKGSIGGEPVDGSTALGRAIGSIKEAGAGLEVEGLPRGSATYQVNADGEGPYRQGETTDGNR